MDATLISQELKEEIGRRGIIAVLEIDDLETAVPVAEALMRGGVSEIELTLRTPCAVEAISEIVRNVPGMLVGAGTVIREDQIDQALAAGARFGFAPGFNPRVVKKAKAVGFPFAPGVSTASELEGAVELGCDVLKLYPAEILGGLRYLNSLAGPYSYLGLKYIPLGGMTLESMPAWAGSDRVLAIGGSWIAKRAIVKARDYALIEKNAREAVAAWKAARG